MLTNWSRLSHAGYFFSGFPPSLILCSSPSGLGAGSYTRSGCWWRVGTCLDLLCCLSEAVRERQTSTEAQREREKEEACGQQFAGMKWPAPWESPAAPIDRLLLMSTPVYARWRQAWIEELHSCIAAWWVSKRCATKSLWHVILQVSTSASVGVNFYCTEEHSTTLLLSKTSETLISVGKSKDAKMRPPDLLNKACNLTEV